MFHSDIIFREFTTKNHTELMQNLVNTFKTKAYFECIIIADNVTVVKALLKQSHNIGTKPTLQVLKLISIK